MKNNLSLLLILLSCTACSASNQGDNADKNNINSTFVSHDSIKASKIYYSYRECSLKNRCSENTPKYRDNKNILIVNEPPSEEFYLGKNNKEYLIYYKNSFSEDYEVGWAKLKLVKSDELNLVLESNKVYQVMGSFNVLGGKSNMEDVQSAHVKQGFYYLEDYYDKYFFNQYQRFTFLKQQDGTLLLDCKNYLNDLDPKNNFSGIFYGVCQDGIKVYFKAM